jgi:hypothetical protein
MRITIEIDQDGNPVTPSAVASASTAASTVPDSAEALDAGGFTAETTAAASQGSDDAGGPPDWLVEEIAARASDAPSSGDQDAGPGPTESSATPPSTSTAGPTTMTEGVDQ